MKFKVLFIFGMLCLGNIHFGFTQQLIPKPLHLESREGSYDLCTAKTLTYSKAVEKEVNFFLDVMQKEFQWKTKSIQRTTAQVKGDFNIQIDTTLLPKLGKEGYKLEINQSNLQLMAASSAGIFYGLQSIRQLLLEKEAHKALKKGTLTLPMVKILDKPRLAWRGFMLDVSRHFFGKETILKLLDEMAFLKMNVFHWHLTDDQGWRIPIKKYPLLTAIASKRDSSQTEVKEYADGTKEFKFDGKPHQGYYTYQDIQEILAYAAERHITVMPEIDMPSHNQAAMAAYPWLSTTGKQTSVPTVFFGEPYYRNPAEINVADPRVIRFFEEVIDEVAMLFPGQTIHLGGDEVWFDLWKQSDEINDFIKSKGFSTYADLQVWFSTKMANYTNEKGKRAMVWNDVLGGHLAGQDPSHQVTISIRPHQSTIIGFWRGDIELMNMAAEKGYEIINGENNYTYFNFDEKALTLAKVYQFNPIPEQIKPQHKSKIIGVTCHLWTEQIATTEKLYQHVFPRIAAMAEVGWTEENNRNFELFKNNLLPLTSRWNALCIAFGSLMN